MRASRFAPLAGPAAGAGPAGSPPDQAAGAIAAITASEPDKEGMIKINFPENLEVRVLIDYVSKRTGVNILYDETLVKQKVTVSSPVHIPQTSLLGLLQSILKMAGLTLVDAEQPGWKKVVAARDMLVSAKGVEKDLGRLQIAEGAGVMTQAFQLQHTAPTAIEPLIKPFLSSPGGNSFAIPGKNLVLVTDYVSNLKRVASVVALADTPGLKPVIRFIPVKHVDADAVARQVQGLLKDKQQAVDPAGKPAEPKVSLQADMRTGQVVVIATEGSETEAIELIKALDVASESPDQSGIGFYKLMNSTAADVLATIRAMEGGKEAGSAQAPPLGPTENQFSGPNYPPPALGSPLPTPPTYTAPAPPGVGGTMPTALAAPPGAMTTPSMGGGAGTSGSPGAGTAGTSSFSQQPQAATSFRTKEAVVTADPNTNSIIVIGPPTVQKMYKQLIAMLDRRRPQVMLEVTLVTLDTSNGFELGVELSKSDTVGKNGNTLVFSSFGLSTMDLKTGLPTLVPGAGFNGILIDPNTINAVVHAVATSSKAEVLSAPKILVNDNATATLSSIAESPFTSINASQTVSTTSFAGYASAGTTITVTPHIAEGDHLQLRYSVTLNSFTGHGAAGIPPPRQTNVLTSEVTVPDGYCVIVGGLNRKNDSDTVTKVPLLGDIPILEFFFGLHNKQASQSTLFVFLRPIILRDDLFEDLKYLSERDLKVARLAPNCPVSKPMTMD
ncbi:MAG: hypothetical protein NTY65_13380 [Planctomycetota bacterium]|nr:hypothetical protein [Planctomycetota bacterium]